MFGLIHVTIIFALKGVDILLKSYETNNRIGLVSGIYECAVFIPMIAVTIRRLHDTNRSGWWYLIIFIPVAGILKLLFIMGEDSQTGGNRYGHNPKIA